MLPNTTTELEALERQVEREWWWLNGALHAAAEFEAEDPVARRERFRAMQEQIREIDRKRVEISIQIANTEQSQSQAA